MAVPAPSAPWRGTPNGAPRPSRTAAVVNPDSDPLLKLAFAFFAVDLFETVSRLLEIATLGWDIRIPYLGVTLHVVTLVLALISGGARRVVASRLGLWLILFTVWMMVCTLASTWRGGSVDTLMREWLPSLIIFAGCGTVVTLLQCQKVTAVLAAGTVVIAGASYLLGTLKADRLAFASGTLGNSNDLSTLIVLGIPFLLVPLFSKGSSRLGKLIAVTFCLMALVVVIKSASRGSLLALIVILLVLFFTMPFAGKMKLGLLTVVMLAAFFAFTPREILSRYVTIFGDAEQGDNIATSAEYSSMARRQLLEQSLKLTMEHPLFGVGPGIFAVGEAKLAEAEGQKAMWHVSHNSYTQVSSEMGIPGLLFYLAALWTTFRNLFWFRAHSRIDPSGKVSAMGLALLLSLVGLCLSLTFASMAYLSYLPVLMGLSLVFRMSLQLDMDQCSAALAASAPPSAVPAKPAAATSRKTVYRFLGRPPRLGA